VDPPYTHGVFQLVRSGSGRPAEPPGRRDEEGNDGAPIR
jgi:hypothetical protein